ncbi:predicted protein [Histoplasma capsulatum H143]|uniref:Uncharacterized protein n=1 Tax=Ajellomyces capsulatus (strain H143) TaxID=544712 RepID=C6HR41_AJECH|nr:predicted protein [Histoplasma capsulatum H143]
MNAAAAAAAAAGAAAGADGYDYDVVLSRSLQNEIGGGNPQRRIHPKSQHWPSLTSARCPAEAGRRDSNIRNFKVVEMCHCARPHSMDHEYSYEQPIGGGDMPQAAPGSPPQ